MKRTILIGYGGSENAEDALALGSVLAELLAARPLVVTVLPYPPEMAVAADFEEALLEETAPGFAKARQALSGFEVDTRALVDRSPGRALHDLAATETPAAVVLGSSHRGRVGRVLAGSVAQAMLSGSPCAIAIAPRSYAAEEARHLLRIAVAVHGTESEPALRAAIALAERTHASLDLLCVTESHSYGYGDAFAVLAGDFEDYEKRVAADTLDEAMKRVPEGLPARRRVLAGPVAEAIAEAAEDFDLLVLGSRAYGPVRRVLLGSVSTKLLQSAPCAVLVVPRGAGDDPLHLEDAEPAA